MEGSENNPVMYELLCELPWRPSGFSKDEWLEGYISARYGKCTPRLLEAWVLPVSYTHLDVYKRPIDEFATPFSEPFSTAAEGEKPWALTANMTVPQEAATWTTWQDADTYMKQFKYDYVEHPEGNNASKNSPSDIGSHIEFVNDAARGKYVFKLTAHAEANEDGSIKCLDCLLYTSLCIIQK